MGPLVEGSSWCQYLDDFLEKKPGSNTLLVDGRNGGSNPCPITNNRLLTTWIDVDIKIGST